MVPSPDLTAALATLRSRWGAAAPSRVGDTGEPWDSRRGVGEVLGALATVPLESPEPETRPDPDRVYSTGFAELDSILGPGGVPRGMGVSLRGDVSSGRTTLALRLAAEAQAAGSIVAWLDLAAALDPVEAVSRGIRPEWLVVLTPADADEGLAIAGSLLAGRAVDLLVIDLPVRLPRSAGAGVTNGDGVAQGAFERARSRRVTEARFADRLGRLAALARRAGITLVVLEAPAALRWLGGAGNRWARGGRRRGDRHPAGAGPSIVDPARPGRGRPANRGDRRPQPGRPTGSPSQPPDPVRGRR